MEFKDTPAEARWRADVRDFVRSRLPKGLGESSTVEGGLFDRGELMQEWRRRVAARGWVAPAWPKEYGGAGLGVKEQFILNEEFAEAGAPQVGGFGVMMLGPTLIVHGNDEQKAEHLPKILAGETLWCQGWSEPAAGSDVASLQTRAARDGDDYVLNGQKIWTTGAQHADWMYMLARTDPDAPKHRGISYLLVDMKSPGVSVRPLTTMAGSRTFNEVFFDSVRVPVRNRVGEENRGWYIGTTTLDFERSSIGNAVGIRKALEGYLLYAKAFPAHVTFASRPSLRLEFADRWIEAATARLLSYRVVSLQARGEIPNYESSMTKLFASELGQRIATLGMHMLGMGGQLLERKGPHQRLFGRVGYGYLGAVSSTIAGGTSEIQRNIIATRGLGLPRD
jgi:alkylation response protein AidB-like acyl-CoA dehydrogenase